MALLMSSRLLLIPLDDVVAFPGMSLTLAIDDLGDGADAGKFLFVSGNEQNPFLLAGVDRERERHAREGDDVVERDQKKTTRHQ